MKLAVSTVKHSVVWTSIRAPNLIATLDGRPVGSWHAVGHQISAYVAGWHDAKLDISQIEWESALYHIFESCTLAIGIKYFDNFAVRFPENEWQIEDSILALCASAVYDEKRQFYVVKKPDEKYLEYLGVRMRSNSS